MNDQTAEPGLPATPEKPLWIPAQDRVDRANLSRFMRFAHEEIGKGDLNSYSPFYRFSVDQPAAFWTLLWDFVGIRGSGERTPVLIAEDGMAKARWFPGVSLNYTQNLLRFDDDRVAIRCHGAHGEDDTISYAQLQRRVAALSAAMRSSGIAPGDCVASILPNLPDTLIAMLATASLGAIWFSCPAGLATDAAIKMLEPLAPRLLFHNESISDLQASLPTLRTTVLVGGASVATSQPIASIRLADYTADHLDAPVEYTSVPFDHPLYLTRATIGSTAGELLVHSTGGTLIQHLKELVLHGDLKREDKIFFHAGNDSMAWYWLASSLAIGATVVLHVGAALPPDQSGLWDLVDEYGISVLGVHSSWLNAAAQGDVKPGESHRLLTLKTILSAGAALSPDSYDYVYRDIKDRVLLVPISTGGETLACFAIGAPMLPVWRGEIASRGLGMKVEVVNAVGDPVVGEEGDLTCAAPFPSMPVGFWNDADGLRFNATYFSKHEGRWCRGDRATLTARESLILAS